MRAFVILSVLMIMVLAQNQTQAIHCHNGGKHFPTNFQTQCVCAPLYIGKHCQTQANELPDAGHYLPLNFNFSHFVFLASEPNLYKFTFDTCMLSNPHELETLIFMTSEQDDGSPHYEPSIFSSAKIKVKEGSCLSFTSPYIQIKKDIPQPFWRIIIGVKALPKAFKNYFFRTVPGKKQMPIPQELIDQQSTVETEFQQKMFFRVTYEVYKESMTQIITKIFVKVVVLVCIIVAICLFCKIALFSYGIDTKHIFLMVKRYIRVFWRKIVPLRREEEKTYRNYMRYRARCKEEEKIRIQSEDCAICLQTFQMSDIIEQTVCHHIYHEFCLEEWTLKNQICPLCRHQLRPNPVNWLNNPHSL